MSEDEGMIISAIAQSDELEIFFTDAVKDIINYKWEKFAKATHWFGWLTHMLYIVALQSYIVAIYLDDDGIIPEDRKARWLHVIGFCLLYPLFYDGR